MKSMEHVQVSSSALSLPGPKQLRSSPNAAKLSENAVISSSTPILAEKSANISKVKVSTVAVQKSTVIRASRSPTKSGSEMSTPSISNCAIISTNALIEKKISLSIRAVTSKNPPKASVFASKIGLRPPSSNDPKLMLPKAR